VTKCNFSADIKDGNLGGLPDATTLHPRQANSYLQKSWLRSFAQFGLE
jgi:hypothetical protein